MVECSIAMVTIRRPACFYLKPAGAVPTAVAPRGQLDVAISAWHPFQDFPFVGPTDRRRDAVGASPPPCARCCRLHRAFSSHRTIVGSGKSLLAGAPVDPGCADPAAALMPPTLEEEELRKRLFAALREGRTAPLRMPSAIWIAPRCAPSSPPGNTAIVCPAPLALPLSLPATGFVPATGSNVALVGDLNRRSLTRPSISSAHKPIAAPSLWTRTRRRENRQTLVRHVLVLIGLPLQRSPGGRRRYSQLRGLVGHRVEYSTVDWTHRAGSMSPTPRRHRSYHQASGNTQARGPPQWLHARSTATSPRPWQEVIVNATDSFATRGGVTRQRARPSPGSPC